MKKNIFVIICFFFSLQCVSFAQTTASSTPQTQTYATYQSCLRQYNLPFEKLYYLALSSISYNKFEILEMQSRSGYILFESGGKEFLLSVMKKDNKISFVKITPADNNYAFSVSIPQKVFSYIDINIAVPVQDIK